MAKLPILNWVVNQYNCGIEHTVPPTNMVATVDPDINLLKRAQF